MKWQITRLTLISTFLISMVFFNNAYALRPVENLVLGDFSDEYSESKSDPLESIFGREKLIQSKNVKDFKRELAIYRGFYLEGHSLELSCRTPKTIRYSLEWEKIQVLRSVISEVQYIGLDLASRAIPQYAKFFEFSDDEYQNLVDDLISNHCSANLSVISKKELKNNLFLKFKKENSFKLPSIKGNPLFPDNLETDLTIKKMREQEFKYTVKMFNSLCSWSGDPTNPALMLPFLKNGALMSFINRQMNNKALEWKENENAVYLKDDFKTTQVWCENLICRKTYRENFLNKLIYSVGGTKFSVDLDSLFCEYFKLLDYVPIQTDPRITKAIKEITFDEENFMVAQYLALITGVPDFLIGLDKFKEGEDMLRSSIDYAWLSWARAQTQNYSKDLYFEEPLTIELVEQRLSFNPNSPDLKMILDVNLGEFDRINQVVGKIKMNFKINIPMSYLRYHREALKHLDFNHPEDKEWLINRLKLQLIKDINYARDLLIIPPWKGDLAYLLARELSEIVHIHDDKFYKSDDSGMKTLTIEVNYSPFALRYLNHQFNIRQKESK
jgi:hypothetical protein